jgi:hypothetical protein
MYTENSPNSLSTQPESDRANEGCSPLPPPLPSVLESSHKGGVNQFEIRGASMASDNRANENKSNRNAEMVRTTNRELQTNPFTTYRDPKTGHWIVIKPMA